MLLKRPYKIYGKITKVSGVYIEASNYSSGVGDEVTIDGGFRGEIIGFDKENAIIMCFDSNVNVKPGTKVLYSEEPVSTYVSEEFLGKVLDPFGNIIYSANTKSVKSLKKLPLSLENYSPMERKKISKIFDSGVRTINALTTIGVGQRIGVFAGAGVGKTTTLGMIMKHSSSDIVVLALIGERGREVREYVEDVLGEAFEKSVVIVSTSDQTPIMKVKGAISALVHARFFASKGYNVLLVMDSLTRLAMAQREIGLSIGEPPTLKGYTPSVFLVMSKIIEGCGLVGDYGITGIFSVLVEGDDTSLDPVADSAMSFLDGHILLSRKIADSGIYPAIDPLKSISRIMPNIVSDEHWNYVLKFKQILSEYYSMEDIIKVGLYRKGSNPTIDKVLEHKSDIDSFFMQNPKIGINYNNSLQELKELLSKIS
ncbi:MULTISPECIES: FliI/YscN family ATPase [unclassified Hydrogenobaculum]|uniref:FliI/YscN family ATPase n=1 Tax=unclassified Hydrogenobaculum TaxID=2622382 RepID=UPI0001C51820|nr:MULTISPECIES: FliI/YscN family ATPase [unclassified Hydrogenobaculum]AEF19037.1 ATPase, FliI/YscN family [Hydrogenobaculum sp. 3684]AEG46324.1 ATPase, FliI/YscN family [Hydrogenobaculum sp. SHO]AGG14969.1 ATPase, FliI/YscN family [Hydrogenobaculum sp. HO]AGH93265.1 ATPase FliI/YscN family [Hydrogenobaculum sp. SN]